MYLSETYEKKWQPVLEHPDLPKIGDSYRRAVTATILENQERAQKEDNAFLNEAAVGAPLLPGLRIFSPDPAAMRLRFAWMFSYKLICCYRHTKFL